MRKHLFGFAIFTFIVVSSVAICTFLRTPPIPQIEAVKIPVRPHVPESNEVPPLLYKLKSFYIDEETGFGTAEVQLEWNSNEAPPTTGVRFDFGVVTPGAPFAGIAVGSYYFNEPFSNGKSTIATCKFKMWGEIDPKVSNYYGYAELVVDDGGTTKLLYTEKNKMADAIPALIKHPKKK